MILCIGTAAALQRTMMFESVVFGEVNRAVRILETASGKSINVARVAATLGEEVLAMGFAGGDRGRFLLADMDRMGLSHDFVKVAANTRECTTVVDLKTRDHTELVEEAPRVTDADWGELLARIDRNVRGAKAVVLSGSLPAGGPKDFYLRCAQFAAGAGAAIIIDARGEHLRETLPLRPLVVKPNRFELGTTVGRTLESDADLRQAMRQIAAAGAQWSVISHGSAAVMISDGRRFWRMVPPKVDVLNTIGCGDSLAAGIAVGHCRGQSMLDAIVLGAACAAANATTVTPGEIDAHHVEDLLARIRLEEDRRP